jgi:hypothetical protein
MASVALKVFPTNAGTRDMPVVVVTHMAASVRVTNPETAVEIQEPKQGWKALESTLPAALLADNLPH